MTAYNPKCAHAEFEFIDVSLAPQGKSDQKDYEGGLPNLGPSVAKQTTTVTLLTGLHIRIPARPLVSIAQDAPPTASEAYKPAKSPDTKSAHMSAGKIRIPLLATKPFKDTPTKTTEAITQEDIEPSDNGSDDDEDKDGTMRHIFCPEKYREPIINMMEKHYCAHPLIPSYAHPSPEGIKKWAVQQIYNFCVLNNVQEVWAYHWENWYRKMQWELWACSVHPIIPVLKMTMILESQ
jgi:hypothetical protein